MLKYWMLNFQLNLNWEFLRNNYFLKMDTPTYWWPTLKEQSKLTRDGATSQKQNKSVAIFDFAKEVCSFYFNLSLNYNILIDVFFWTIMLTELLRLYCEHGLNGQLALISIGSLNCCVTENVNIGLYILVLVILFCK